MQIPSDYIEGYERARLRDPLLASRYVECLYVGDPEADLVVEHLAEAGREDSARFITAAMEQDEAVLLGAPTSLKDFFAQLDTPPEWFDPAMALPGARVP